MERRSYRRRGALKAALASKTRSPQGAVACPIQYTGKGPGRGRDLEAARGTRPGGRASDAA